MPKAGTPAKASTRLHGSGTTVAVVVALALAVVWPLPASMVKAKVKTSVMENGVPPGALPFTAVPGVYTNDWVPFADKLALAD